MSNLSPQQLFNARQKIELESRQDYINAQVAYEKAAAKKAPLLSKIKWRRDHALVIWRRRRVLTKQAKAALIPDLHPERTNISPNKSSRDGVKPRLIVLHITVSHNRPGLADLDGILSFFDQHSTQASSHVVNDAEGNDGRCVPDEYKAWTQAAFNRQALSIEQIEYSDKRTRAEWLSGNDKQLTNTAEWVAYWSHKYDIPIKISTDKGVCEHRNLGAAGGGHSDCGVGYPIDVVLSRALKIRKDKYGS